MKYAGFFQRLAAKIVDAIIFSLLIVLNILLVKPANNSLSIVLTGSINLINIAYNILFIAFKGKTPGKMLMKIKVVRTNGGSPDLKNAAARELIGITSLVFWLLQYLLLVNSRFLSVFNNLFSIIVILENFVYFFNPKRKTLHDYIADTVVVEGK